jgi:hypothetical protein
MVIPNVRGPIPAVVTVDASVSFGMSSSGGAAPRLVVGPVGPGTVDAGVEVAGTSVVAVATVLEVGPAGVNVGLSSLQALANKRPAAATQCTRRRRRAERVREHPLLFTPVTLAAGRGER